MSDSSSDEIHVNVKRPSIRKSINSDEEGTQPPRAKRRASICSSSDSSTENSFSLAIIKRSSGYPRASSKAFVKDTYESARDRFLENNASENSDGFINDNESLDETSSTASSEGEESDREFIEEMNGSLDDKQKQSEDDGAPVHRKHPRRVVIHSDRSESEEKSVTPVSSRRKRIRRKKKSFRKRVKLPSASEGESDEVDNSNVDSVSHSSDSNTIVDDDSSDMREFRFTGEHSATELQLIDDSKAFLEIMRSMVLGALDPDYFSTEDFKDDRYIAKAFSKIFDPLEALTRDLKSQAWCEEFIEALNRPKFTCISISNMTGQRCEACPRKIRYASYSVILEGLFYDKTSLKPLMEAGEDSDESWEDGIGEESSEERNEEDETTEESQVSDINETAQDRTTGLRRRKVEANVGDNEPLDKEKATEAQPPKEETVNTEDDESSSVEEEAEEKPKSVFYVGKYCLKRAESYHNALHFKHCLLDICLLKTKQEKFKSKSADDIVEELTAKTSSWVDNHYHLYNELLEKSRKLISSRNKTNETSFF
ncbi:dentin matrix acidic phosphoprotein 1-like [Watersipora subatra]|uniref:dentin matrix acidic phosphoprotein 1-like n=1 Tax=Watersipora subatra TaxID=2589382 RepID=UPI00355C4CC0